MYDVENALMCKAINNYANHAPLDLKSPQQIKDDLLAIAGERHYHVSSIGSDQCAICLRDLRNDIHFRWR